MRRSVLIVLVLLAVGVGVIVLLAPLGERVRTAIARLVGSAASSSPAVAAVDDHAGHDHAGHDDLNSLELSPQAQKTIGLTLGRVSLTTFERTITIPGIIVERPGRSTLAITAPLTGIVTEIDPIQGEAVEPGRRLFALRLTHEELVQAQSDFLRVAEELDVVRREIARLEKLAADGGIAGRQVLERQYEEQNKEAVLRAQQQALLLHGLSAEQVAEILRTHTLLKDMEVRVPAAAVEAADGRPASTRHFEIQELRIARGQSVNAGDTLAVLADHSELFIEGSAFDKDVALVNRAVENGWSVGAVFETEEAKPEALEGLKILYVAGKVDRDSRTFHFYLPLSNSLVRDVSGPGNHRFLSWRYKPGQRLQLSVPVEQWPDRIVLPVDAVAQDGVENYVFTPNGDHFDRRPVHVEYRDRRWVVIANDGSLFAGDAVVTSSAPQMQLALKTRSGGGIDPHAGHNH